MTARAPFSTSVASSVQSQNKLIQMFAELGSAQPQFAHLSGWIDKRVGHHKLEIFFKISNIVLLTWTFGDFYLLEMSKFSCLPLNIFEVLLIRNFID